VAESLTFEPFRVTISDDVLDDLHERLVRARLSAAIPDTGWDYGTDRAYLDELVAYWRDEYDWRRAEARLNTHDQFVTEIDGARVHALHVRSPEPDALPLVLVHGWPGSIVEFLDIVGPLADPRAHGGDPADAFHVVCPSIPGYGFSGPTRDRGWDPRRVARAFAELMAGLGYDRYAAQGGDWGSAIATQLALHDAPHLVGIHLNLVIVPLPRDLDHAHLTDAERAALDARARYSRDDSGYAKIQGTRPQTIGYALDDSPVGLAAWIIEKFRTWSDCDGDLERSYTKDQLLDNVMLYWLTGTAHSAGRLYFEAQHSGRGFAPGERVEVPTGVAAFPREIIGTPRNWAEAFYNIVHWSEMPRGGHFAAMEEGELLTNDIRACFRPLWGNVR
jgi:pimeloyl-ACP methyl ester carboxylesterase